MRPIFFLFLFRCCLAGIFMCCFYKSIYAQNQNNNAQQPLIFRSSYQLLHSTHGTNFNGGSVDANRQFTNRLIGGIGIQYAATPKHPDNGWMLTRLHLLPVYLNGIYLFKTKTIVQPYLHSEAGMSC